jgi:hypothetical protein
MRSPSHEIGISPTTGPSAVAGTSGKNLSNSSRRSPSSRTREEGFGAAGSKAKGDAKINPPSVFASSRETSIIPALLVPNSTVPLENSIPATLAVAIVTR